MIDNNRNDNQENYNESDQQNGQDKKRNMMGKMSGNVKSKAKGKIKAKLAGWFTKTFIVFVIKVLPIFLAVCAIHTVFSWVADIVESKKNAEDVYNIMNVDDISDLVCIAGNSEDGYYLAYKQGLDDKLTKIAKSYNKGSRQYVSKDVLKKMLEAELYTQFPNLGGKIGKEANLKIGESIENSDSNNTENDGNSSTESNSKKENVMDIKNLYQNDAKVTFVAHKGKSFSDTGSGIACVSMILSYIKDKDVSFQEVINWADKSENGDKYYNGSEATTAIFADAAEHWNAGKVTETKDINKVKKSLLDGKPVVSYQKTSRFAVDRNFIVLKGIDSDGKIVVNNPNKNKEEGSFSADQIEENKLEYWIFENGTPSSEVATSTMVVSEDTGKGEDGFQGAVRIRRITPNKTIGDLSNVGIGNSNDSVTITGSLGTKEAIPEKIRKQMEGISMRNISGITYDELSYLSIPYYDFNGNKKMGHMIVNAKLADEVLLIFQELYNIKYPIEKMDLIDNYSGGDKKVGSSLDYASIDQNNTSAFNDRKSVTNDGEQETVSAHAYGQAIDINPQINPYINSDGTCSHSNAKQYATGRDKKDGWSDSAKAACITQDSEIYKIFTKYGWTWLGNSNNTGDTQHFQKTDMTNVKTADNNATVANNGNNANNESDPINASTDKQSAVENILKNASGDWSVYAKDLKSNDDIASVNADKKMQSASVIKLFIMATVYDEVKNNSFSTGSETSGGNTVGDDVKLMITESNNDATNRLIDKVGLKKMNTYIKNNGYSNTELNRKMLASTKNGDNYTSAKDAAKILEEIYNHKCVSYEASEQMMIYLKAQTRTSKIPAGVPDGVETANKTGELDTVENDAAIVFKKDAPYVLVVMSSGLNDTAKARQNIVDISSAVYGEGAQDKSSSANRISTQVVSKIYDLKFIPEEDFNKLVDDNDVSALEYFTLDKDWKLITAKWDYSDTDGVTISKNSPIDYKSSISKYTTPFEYLMDYYIDLKNNDFMNDFTDLIFDSELILAVQDNVSTTETKKTVSIEYEDGTSADGGSETSLVESDSVKLEITYVDTWFVKFSKESSYTVASFNSTAGSLTGSQGDLVGNYRTTSYCYVCNDDGSGNFGTSVTASGRPATTHRTVAIHASGDPNGLKLGDQIMLEGDPTVYVVEDTGTGQPGAWIDVYVDPTSTNRGSCCINSEYADKHVNVYRANDVRAVTDEDTTKDDKGNDKSLINTVASVAGKVTDSISISTSSSSGPTKTGVNPLNKKTYTIGSTKYDTTTVHNISVQYDTGESTVTGNEEKFLKLFKDNKDARRDLKPKWLITTVEKGQKTANLTDLTKYLLYKLTGDSYGKTEFDFSEYEPGSFSSLNGGGGYTFTGSDSILWRNNFKKEDFVNWVQNNINISGGNSSGWDLFFKSKADQWFDICTEQGIDPIVMMSIGMLESGFGNSKIARDKGNLWGWGAADSNPYGGAASHVNGSGDISDAAMSLLKSICQSLKETADNPFSGTRYSIAVRNGAVNPDLSTIYGTGYWYCSDHEGWITKVTSLMKTYFGDFASQYCSGGDFLEIAKQVHDYIRENNFFYASAANIAAGHYVGDASSEGSHIPPEGKYIDCSGYVTWVLAQYGYTELGDGAWQKATDWYMNQSDRLAEYPNWIYKPATQAEAGDVVVNGHHMEIYAGNGQFYNAGSTNAINKEISDSGEVHLSSFTYAITISPRN